MIGLTEAEVLARRARGEGNDAEVDNGRSTLSIVRNNLFSFFNIILYAVGILLIVLGQTSDALLSVGLGVINAMISTVQEVRAKKQLEKVALLSQPQVTVLRDGQQQVIRPKELVLGDWVLLQAGEQAVVDGRLLTHNTPIEMDESLLTGETDLIRKKENAPILSGSYCVTGQGFYEVEAVGSANYANQVTASAREYEVSQTPLQHKINFVVRLVMLLVTVMSFIIFAAAILEDLTLSRLVEMAAVLTGLVPYGLFTMIVSAYALGSSKIAKQGALVQQTNAIESLSNIDVLCMDKTGTLTTNALEFEAIKPLTEQLTKEEIGTQLGMFAHTASAQNKTSEAIANAFTVAPQPLLDEVPFASARKWSAIAVESGVYVLGAIEMLTPYLSPDTADKAHVLHQQAQAWSDKGLRVLLFAYSPDATTLHEGESVQLPPLTPLAVVSLRDQLRPYAIETLATFEKLGIDLKIISGDNPHTVAALAKQAGIKNTKLISGTELAERSPAELQDIVNNTMVFGRITPEQKQVIVDTLIKQGHYVAMMGDGVNDVLSLKKAQVGIAMQSGSQATRNVADMVLLQDSFGALHPAFSEGQNIIGGLIRSLYLFTARSATYAFIIIGIAMMGLNFPFEPAQVALTLFSVGIPALFLTLRSTPLRLEQDIVSSLVRFVLPTALLTMLFGLTIYTFMFYNIQNRLLTDVTIPQGLARMFEERIGLTYNVDAGFEVAGATIVAQSLLSVFVSYTGLILLLFLEPPHTVFEGWTSKSDQRWPLWLTVVLWVVFTAVVFSRDLSVYFGLMPMNPGFLLGIWTAVVLWVLILRTLWRSHWLDRMLGLE